jgi:hypothetical protein
MTDQLPTSYGQPRLILCYKADTRARDAATSLYMRLYKECQAAGIALRNYEFDRQRTKIVEALDIFACSATSCECERAFSIAKKAHHT